MLKLALALLASTAPMVLAAATSAGLDVEAGWLLLPAAMVKWMPLPIPALTAASSEAEPEPEGPPKLMVRIEGLRDATAAVTAQLTPARTSVV